MADSRSNKRHDRKANGVSATGPELLTASGQSSLHASDDRHAIDVAIASAAALMYETSDRASFYEDKARKYRRAHCAGLSPDLGAIMLAIQCYRVARECHLLSIRAGRLCAVLLDRKRGDGLSTIESLVMRELDVSRASEAD